MCIEAANFGKFDLTFKPVKIEILFWDFINSPRRILFENFKSKEETSIKFHLPFEFLSFQKIFLPTMVNECLRCFVLNNPIPLVNYFPLVST